MGKLITAAELETGWPLTGVSVAATMPGYGAQDGVLEVHADQGAFAAKVAIDPLPPWHGDLYVLDYLAGRRFPHAPRLLHTRDGHRVARSGDRVACVLDWVPRTAGQGLSPAGMWAQMGEAVGLLNACDEFPATFAIPVTRALDELAARVKGLPFEREYLALLERLRHLGQLAPQALIHGELHPANARQAEDGTIVLVDWEMAGSAHPALEYGYPLILCFISAGDHTVDEDSGAAFYRGYASTGASVDPGLAFDAALFHALRHMWWRETWQRWHRILFALENEAVLRDLVS
jgi:Ser/Thr protein kinase RdoA (MazF antagonist)